MGSCHLGSPASGIGRLAVIVDNLVSDPLIA